MSNYVVYHPGTGTLVAAADGLYVVDLERISDEQYERLEVGVSEEYLEELGAVELSERTLDIVQRVLSSEILRAQREEELA